MTRMFCIVILSVWLSLATKCIKWEWSSFMVEHLCLALFLFQLKGGGIGKMEIRSSHSNCLLGKRSPD